MVQKGTLWNELLFESSKPRFKNGRQPVTSQRYDLIVAFITFSRALLLHMGFIYFNSLRRFY